MSSTIASASGLATLALLLLSSTATAQIVGCDAVNCPVDEYRTAQCEVGNSTLKAIGIANLTTTLDTQPLTWTVGLQELKSNDTKVPFDRNYYLGLPQSVQLNGVIGCALFFDGVSANLSAEKGQEESFSCSKAMAESCVTDLVKQAESNFKDIGNATTAGSDLCNRLRDSLVDQPPSTCNGLQGSWGAIQARPLTGAPAPQPVDQKQCHPTTGKDYSMFLVESTRKVSNGREISQLAPIVNAITPIMTVFAKDNKADVKLSCLKLVESKANQTVDTPPQKGSASVLASSSLLISTVLAITYAVVL